MTINSPESVIVFGATDNGHSVTNQFQNGLRTYLEMRDLGDDFRYGGSIQRLVTLYLLVDPVVLVLF
jgi:hypothetical protein